MISRHFYSILTRKSPTLNKLSFYTTTLHHHFASMDPVLQSKDKIQLLRKQPWFQDYQTATKLNSQEKYTDALRLYYKVIQTMEEKNQKGQAYYFRMFEKVLKINVLLNRPLETEENLYKMIKVKKALQKNPILVYEDYQNLMIHQLSHNVQKSIKLGKALLSQSQINHLPITNQKHIRMLLGNAYLLVDNYADAKKKYGEVLQMKPSYMLRGKTLNNLAIACWWHKNPMFQVRERSEYEEVRVNRDFNQAKELLMNAIGAVENIDQMQEQQAVALESLLNQNPESMLALSSKSTTNNSAYTIQSREALQPIYNLVQYYIYNDPIQKPLILAWMRILLKAASRAQNGGLIDQVTAKYYLLNGQVNQLKKTLKSSNAKYNNQSSKEQSLTQKLQQLQHYKMMSLVNRIAPQEQFNVEGSKIKTLQSQLLLKDKFIFRRQFLMSQEMSFMSKQK